MTNNQLIDLNGMSPQQIEALQGEINARRFKGLEKTTENLDERVTKIEEEAPVSSAISNLLTRKRRGRVISWLGGKCSKAYKHEYRSDEKEHYKQLRNKVFAEMERDFKDYFEIENYSDLPKKSRQDAEEYISQWEPSNNTRLEIRLVNNQLELLQEKA